MSLGDLREHRLSELGGDLEARGLVNWSVGRPVPSGSILVGIVPGKDTGACTRAQVVSLARFAGQEHAGEATEEAEEIIDVEPWKKSMTACLGLDEKLLEMVTDVTASQAGVEEHIEGLAIALEANIDEATGIDGERVVESDESVPEELEESKGKFDDWEAAAIAGTLERLPDSGAEDCS